MNAEENLHYIGSISDTKYFGVNEMVKEERQECLAWYDSQKSEIFDNRRVQEKYYQDDDTVVRDHVESLGANSCKL